MIDTHAHLEFPSFNSDIDDVIKRSFDKGLSHIVNVGGNAERNKNCIAIAAKNKNIYAAVGIHPEDCDIDPFAHAMAELKKSSSAPKVVAIGETGLDKHNARADIEIQKDFFEAQIDLAREMKLPLIIHIRDAYAEALEIIKQRIEPKQKFVVHCFSGTKEFADEILKIGGMISFTGIVTFPNAKEIAEVAKSVPLEKIMVETDAPFLAPQEVRGKRCEPWHVIYTAKFIAKLRGIQLSELEKITDETARKFFGI